MRTCPISCLIHFVVLGGLRRWGGDELEDEVTDMMSIKSEVPVFSVTLGVRSRWEVGGHVAFGGGGEEV